MYKLSPNFLAKPHNPGGNWRCRGPGRSTHRAKGTVVAQVRWHSESAGFRTHKLLMFVSVIGRVVCVLSMLALVATRCLALGTYWIHFGH